MRKDQNDKHDAEMRQFRDEQERKDDENRRAIDKLKSEHAAALKQTVDNHERENRAREDRHKSERLEASRQFKLKVDELNAAHENTRLTKDAEIKALTEKFDQARAAYKTETDALKMKIHELQTTLESKISTIISLEQTLAKKEDVEAQLDEALDREENNRAARQELRNDLETATDYSL